MKVAGIIAEYNPFHNGHLYQLEQTRGITGADFVVAVMSGNFLQRGEPAMVNKWMRSRMAVINGADLVLELPFAFACNHSGMFARGAVEILNGLGVVTHLSFGAEEPDLAVLGKIAEITALEEESYRHALRNASEEGLSYGAARQRAVEETGGLLLGEQMDKPNNILAIEYMRHLILTKSSIQPMAVKRKGPGYHDEIPFGDIASATCLRNMVKGGETIQPYIPEATGKILKEAGRPLFLEDFASLIFYRLLQQEKNSLSEIYSAGEGLENRFAKFMRTSPNLLSLIQQVKSRRYAETRVKRMLFQGLMGLTKSRMDLILKEKLLYGRILAFNDRGRELIKMIRKEEGASIPLITNINKELQEQDRLLPLLEMDILASDIYNLAAGLDRYGQSDFVQRPYYHKEKL